ncbi:MFS transporter [Leifsonia sp. LS-T14]|uniref:MFS transporter n=1 Tax=unclassified Leifsonia TaxID=2663824 RepID=UPI0035A621C9
MAQQSSSAESAQSEFRRRQARSVANTLRGSAGNLVEWYDVYAYSVFAVYFEKQFFSPEDQNSQLYIWAIFAVTFLMRPLGSWLFGRFADRRGRKVALSVSISLMAACSLGIALTPAESVLGIGSALLLVGFRLVQGLATGGEYGTSATYMSEAALPGKRGFFSSFQYVTLVGGHVLAQLTLLVMITTLPADAITSWGWRVAFAIGGVGALVVLWLRTSMDESLSPETIAANRSGAPTSAGSLRELLGRFPGAFILCFLVTMGGTLAFYAYSVNGPKMIQAGFADGNAVTGTLINLAALVCLMVLQPLGGLISDRIGRKPLLIFFGVGAVCYTWVLYTVLPQARDPFVAFSVLLGGFVILTGYTSINAVVKAELFPTRVRALGVGVGYALANSVFGGTAPLLYSGALQAQQVPLFVGYVTVITAASLLVYIFGLRNNGVNWLDDPEAMERRRAERNREPVPVAAD